MVLAGDLTGGWGSLRVLDTTQIKLEPKRQRNNLTSSVNGTQSLLRLR